MFFFFLLVYVLFLVVTCDSDKVQDHVIVIRYKIHVTLSIKVFRFLRLL